MLINITYDKNWMKKWYFLSEIGKFTRNIKNYYKFSTLQHANNI